MNTNTLTFESERGNLARHRLVEETLSPAAGQVLARIDHFALTANNITYGVAGDSIGYWQFFPAEAPWGRIPVWGFAEVVESHVPGVPAGERLYGYFPMSSHVLLEPTRIGRRSFVDGAEHRSTLPVVYNQYVRTAADPGYDSEREPEQMLYRPLFTTSFFLDDFLTENGFFGAATVVLTSASSKTAIGLAHLLAGKRSDRPRVVGLTSARNLAFVRGLGCYDDALSYEDVGELPRVPTVLVDMAGSGSVRSAVHGHLKDDLRYSCAVGATHWDAATVGRGDQSLPGPRPEMFFAPTQIQKRIGEWGQAEFDARLGAAWTEFLKAADGWIQVEACRGPEALARVYDAFIDGSADPARGYAVSLLTDD